MTTAQAEGTLGLSDEAHILYAAGRGFLVVTHDQLDFRRWHAIFQRQGRPHGGIVMLPQTSLAIVEIRLAMLLDWIALEADYRSRLFRWNELQRWLIQGNRLAGYSEADVRLALGQFP
jgi:hypothetical protein